MASCAPTVGGADTSAIVYPRNMSAMDKKKRDVEVNDVVVDEHGERVADPVFGSAWISGLCLHTLISDLRLSEIYTSAI